MFAQKFVLKTYSQFFKEIPRNNKHSHPLNCVLNCLLIDFILFDLIFDCVLMDFVLTDCVLGACVLSVCVLILHIACILLFQHVVSC